MCLRSLFTKKKSFIELIKKGPLQLAIHGQHDVASLLGRWCLNVAHSLAIVCCTVKILKFGIPQTIAIIVLKIEKFDVTLH